MKNIITNKKSLVFATHNQNKVDEIKDYIPKNINLLSLNDIGHKKEIEESGKSFYENASIKASYIYNKYNVSCFSDDSGLEVDYLSGRPGIYSARYAGKPYDNQKNIDYLLNEMGESKFRSANFKTYIVLIHNSHEEIFEGKVNGEILFKRKGSDGFGYDSIFLPVGLKKSFAELSLSEKNKISHRGIATRKLVKYLNDNFN
ncbi:MAG: non-canonical purine NTP pyrophosphatase, RdgB/HAM1 family [Flavobacteriaceae bacterium]|nr:non-canonical purine NTP pyrophosphatase, RdgB/HAM1 family [Flavobacteriaceae bacterium]|tara:strand:- start:8498 stop:9103 length:606 start_codon:yes stop_codon:yes gene_type:complete